MAKHKKPEPPVLTRMREAQERIAKEIADTLHDDALAAYRRLKGIVDSGDINGERRQAALAILKIAGIVDKQSTTTTKATVDPANGGKVEVVIVENTKPPPDEDDD